jgi:type I protein arginine methyltransferase
MYSLADYGAMLADEVRMRAYELALRQTVKTGMVVLEIGTGPGALAVLACQLGAKRVYAVESSPVIQVAREIAAANACADKVKFLEGVSTQVVGPIQADVMVSDLRGTLPLLDLHIPSIVDARRRFLAPGATMIGRADRLWVAIVEAPDMYSKTVGPWEHNPLGQDRSAARRRIVNETFRFRPEPEQLLTSPGLWATLDYRQIEDPDVEGELSWQVTRDGTGHGIVIWFDADLAEGVEFSTGPGSAKGVYGPMFLPWQEPVALVESQHVCVNLTAKLLEKEYFWRWSARIESLSTPKGITAQFDQSQIQGAVLSSAQLLKGTSKYVPRLSREGLMRRRALELMDGKASLEEISMRLAAEFPERFAGWEQALTFAGAVSGENSG